MSLSLVIGLHPSAPTDEASFLGYLAGLTITAYQVDFQNPTTAPGPPHTEIGIAQYAAPNGPQIFQLIDGVTPQAAAAAVIEVPAAMAAQFDVPEPLIDVVLEVTRGATTIVDNDMNFDVQLDPVVTPAGPLLSLDGVAVGLYLTLPDPSLPAGYLAAAPGGGPPTYAQLTTAVTAILAEDPGGAIDTAQLSAEQCLHIAREIVANRTVTPLPAPIINSGPDSGSPDVGALYTLPVPATITTADTDRHTFESSLLAYYSELGADATTMAGYVFAWSTAQLNAQMSAGAIAPIGTSAALTLPVLPPTSADLSQVPEATLILTAVNPQFAVDAEFFYALTAAMPTAVSASDRYAVTTGYSEATSAAQLELALESGLLAPGLALTPLMAARRLAALGGARTSGQLAGQPALPATDPAFPLVQAWLGSADPIGWQNLLYPDGPIWDSLLAVPANAGAYLRLVVCALTGFDGLTLTALIAAIAPTVAAGGLGVANVGELATVTASEWTAFLTDNPQYIPGFTQPPGTIVDPSDRIATFIRFLSHFYAVPPGNPATSAPTPAELPLLDRYGFDPIASFLVEYQALTGSPYTFGVSSPDDAAARGAVAAVFPGEVEAQEWLLQALAVLRDLAFVTSGLVAAPNETALEFSIMEGLFARGFTSIASIIALDEADFAYALTGSVAFQWASQIWIKAGGSLGPPAPAPGSFKPVNPGGLRDCIPPPELSPLGPVEYLHELLEAGPGSTCAQPAVSADSFGALLLGRRGDLGSLAVTRANLETPLPVVDLVNECLEYLAAQVAASGGSVSGVGGVVYDTARHEVRDHLLRPPGTPPEPGEPYHHDPAALFGALPENSTPASSAAEPSAYSALAHAYSSPELPYAQPLDVSRSYLSALGITRAEAMRRFRARITEFVLGPDPVGFDSAVWRYPLRRDIAPEYLELAYDEYLQLFATPVSTTAPPPAGELGVWQLYGFAKPVSGWINTVLRVSEFLRRTGLSYCEFVELANCGFVPMHLAARPPEPFADCEPCHLDELKIAFGPGVTPVDALMELAVFIRLWRLLQRTRCARYTFAQLADICEVLGLFVGGAINPDFIPQLVALQILRDELCLPLAPRPAPPGATGVERTPLLALWVVPAAGTQWEWALGELLARLPDYATAHYDSRRDEPDLVKVIAANLDPLSQLAGFDPGVATDTWHHTPTRTLRFVEVLAKLDASLFTTGSLEFLCTAAPHLDGDDPFPLQSQEEAHDDPLGLPLEDGRGSLWDLRRELLAVELDEREVQRWTWLRIDAALRGEFGYDPGVGPDPLTSLAQHCFPGVLEQAGLAVPAADRHYSVPLASTTPGMWNADPDSPIHYGSGALEAMLPLSDESMLALLARLRQLLAGEADALRNLYWLPRVDLDSVAFLFEDPREADRRLLQEPDEERRWHYFRRSFVLARERCRVIARHLARHAGSHGDHHEPGEDEQQRAWLVLRSLYADGNTATTPWEAAQPSGAPPAVTWPTPTAGAFAALLGLCGTGLAITYALPGGPPLWSEQSGPLEGFGAARDELNAPLPTLIPSIDPPPGAPSPHIELRNGFALSDRDDRDLGGAEAFAVTFSGVLLVEHEGRYRFAAGAPTDEGASPSVERAEHSAWRVTLVRGQREWVLLSHDWTGQANTEHEAELDLRRGAYDITVEYERPEPHFDDPDEVRRRHAGLQVKYSGPDTHGELMTIPHRRLFIAQRDRLKTDADRGGVALQALANSYVSSLSDIRRTYQRAFKAVLLTSRFDLSAHVAEDGQSELSFMLAHSERFAGSDFFRSGAAFTEHRAQFDLNFLPVLDNYFTPPGDDRATPSVPRQAALRDWWERLFDYSELRRENARAQAGHRHPRLWRLFAAAAAANPTDVMQLMPNLEVPLDHNDLVQRYSDLTALLGEPELTAEHLRDERWPIRAWKAQRCLADALVHAYTTEITEARPDRWVAENPSLGTPSGNDDLTKFVGDVLLEMGEPRRYRDLREIDDGLRERARRPLLAYLCTLDRVKLPGPPTAFAHHPRDLTDLLLIDVQAGLRERASRIDDAVTAVQAFVERALMRLEPGVHLGKAFREVWEARFQSFRVWQACKRREIYPENVIECEEHEHARRHEAFRLLADELRVGALSIPVPAGIQHWDGRHPAPHPCLTVLQASEPSTLHLPVPPTGPIPADAAVPTENFGLLGRPDRSARNSWLSPLRPTPQPTAPRREPEQTEAKAARPRRTKAKAAAKASALAVVVKPTPDPDGRLPYWIEAAVELGVRFLRIAAAGEPAGSALPEPTEAAGPCCCECGKVHPPHVDEYYFWLAKARYFDTPAFQQADLTNPDGLSRWEDPATFPTLLDWESGPMVHLHWCRVHNGEFGQLRRSKDGVALDPALLATPGPPMLELQGRLADSLVFAVGAGIVPSFEGDGGFAWQPPYPGWNADTGWRYDLADDDAELLPLLVTPTPPVLDPPGVGGPPLFGGLAAYPFFVYGTPGASLIPLGRFAPATAIAGALRCHCQFEDAVRWYERYYDPFVSDNEWVPPAPPPHVARDRAVLLDVLETLLCWGDAVLAVHADCGRPSGNSPELAARARVIYAAAGRILGPTPVNVLLEPPSGPPPKVGSFTPLPAPLNPRLMTLYMRTADRFSTVHEWENRARRRWGELDQSMSFWGDDPSRWGHDDDCQCGACGHCGECACCAPGLCELVSPYRFDYLLPRAIELAGEVHGLGAALLAAYEKGDAEFMESLRATQQHQLQQLTLASRKDQWRDADWQVQALKQARLSAQNQVAYYTGLVQNGLIANELLYQDLTGVGMGLQVSAQALELVAQVGSDIPDTYVGTDDFIRIPMTGASFTNSFTAVAKALGYLAQDALTGAGLALTEAGWDRRLAEWKHQIDIFSYEVERLTREILGAERRVDATLRELNNQQREIEYAQEIDDFLRDKFSNHALYLFLQRRTGELYRQLYELALARARQAEHAFNLERGLTDERFIEGELWDDLHQGLLAGERLTLDLRRMDRAYRDCNRREYELTKQISLQRDFPLAFLQLKLTGRCELHLPEWMFDLDYPGQYMRRVKSVALTIPCVTGPYTGVHCRLTLLSSTTRTQPWLAGEVAHCCCHDKDHCTCCAGDDEHQRERLAERYRPLPGDPRLVRSFSATDAIATSTGTNDSGLFELSFRDERYLPFEYAGAVSHWRIELPPENNQFDFDTLTDVILRLSYTSREGGEELRRAASAGACCRLPGDGLRLFDVRHDFPDAWPALREWDEPEQELEKPTALEHGHGDGDRRRDRRRRLDLGFRVAMFPFVPERRVRFLDRLMLVFSAPDADPGNHHLVRFRKHGEDDRIEDVECIATGAWPGTFCGAVELSGRELGPLGQGATRCSFEFPASVGEVCNVFVVARYLAECWPRCGDPRRGECCNEGRGGPDVRA